MTTASSSTFRRAILASAATMALFPVAAWAQASDCEGDADIIVTGTLIRGVAPAGASPIITDAKKIQESGATTVAQLLQTIPQLASFGQLQTLSTSTPELSVNRPNLRSLPGFQTSGGSSTLVLLDGHRI